METTYEYANELGKQGGKNPRKIPKFSINHERFSRTIEKNIYKMTHTNSSYGILKWRTTLVGFRQRAIVVGFRRTTTVMSFRYRTTAMDYRQKTTVVGYK